MKLLFVADGRSVHTQRWVQWFADEGHETHLLTDSPWTGPDRSVRVHALDDVCGASGISIHQLKRSPQSLHAARTWAANLRADVVHGHFLLGYGHAAMLLAGASALALTAWGSDVYLMPSTSLVSRALTRRALRRADLVTGDSADLNNLLRILGAAAPELVSFGVDTMTFRQRDRPGARHALGLPERGRIVLSARSLRSIYNIDVVADAFIRLSEPARLVVKDYRGDPEIIAQVRATLKDRDDVVWVDEVDHGSMPLLYSCADAVVSLANSDSAPVTLLESWACGVPVVVTDLPSVREWTEPDDDFLLVPPRDPEAVALALDAVLGRDDAWRQSWANRHREIVVARADVDVEMGRVERMYAALAQPTRRIST